MTTRKKIAIVLWVITALALFGGFVNGDNFDMNLFNWIGFFIPTLIGFGLWFGNDKKENNKKD